MKHTLHEEVDQLAEADTTRVSVSGDSISGDDVKASKLLRNTYSSSTAGPTLEVNGYPIPYHLGRWSAKNIKAGSILVFRYREKRRTGPWKTKQEVVVRVTRMEDDHIEVIPHSEAPGARAPKPKQTKQGATAKQISYASKLLARVSDRSWLDAETPGPKPTTDQLRAMSRRDVSELIDDLKTLTGLA